MVTELSVQPNAKLAFKLRKGSDQETGVSYDAKTEQLTVDRTRSGITSFEKGFAEKVSAPLKLKEGKLKLRFFVDESSLEVFANDGEAVVSSLIFPDPTSNRLELTALEGSVMLESAHFYPIQTIWRDEDVNAVKPQRIVLSRSTLDMPVNGSQLVEASVIPLSAPQLLKWQSSSDAIATVSAVDGGAMVKGVQAGQAEIKAISPDGGVVSSFKVFVYDTN